MLATMLLPLLGLALFATVFDGSDDELASTTSPPEDLEGTDGADELIGTGGDDLLSGLEGPDVLRGYGGDDTLLGGAEDDLAVGGPGDDSLQGSTGEDTLWGREGDDLLDGSFGDDTLRGDDGDDVLRGGEGDDALLGGAGNDALIGNQGDDLIETGTGEDTVFGGEGNDRITGFNLPVSDGFAPGEEDDGPDRLNGGDGDDTITGNAGDLVSGGAGADLIRSFGYDQEEGGGVTVTDFDPVEDSLLLAVSSGSELSLDADDADLEITQASNGTDTNVAVNGVLLAVLQDTDAAVLAADTSWLVNITDAPDADLLSGAVAAPDVGGIDTEETETLSDAEDIVIEDEGVLSADEAPVADAMDPDADEVSDETMLAEDVDTADLDDVMDTADPDDGLSDPADIFDDLTDPMPLEEDEMTFAEDLLVDADALLPPDDMPDDAPVQEIVRVTGFDPAADTFVISEPDGSDAIIDDVENLLIRAAENGEDTEVVYRGALVAVLEDTDAAALASDQSWIGNAFGLPEGIVAPLETAVAA